MRSVVAFACKDAVDTSSALRGPSELARLADRVSDLLKALSNPVRLILACQLAEGEKSVSELQEFVGITQSAVSQHLSLLRQRKLVSARRDGQSVYYALASPDLIAIMKALETQFCGVVAEVPVPRRPARSRRST
jgi:DNA-binding transcriptional ArsR family regulator